MYWKKKFLPFIWPTKPPAIPQVAPMWWLLIFLTVSLMVLLVMSFIVTSNK